MEHYAGIFSGAEADVDFLKVIECKPHSVSSRRQNVYAYWSLQIAQYNSASVRDSASS